MANKPKLKERDVAALLSATDDYRAVIAAGKVQRWEVVKWAVLINLGFAIAAVTDLDTPGLFLGLAVLVAITGIVLVLHYNRRMTGARGLADKLSNKLAEDCLDVRKVEDEKRDPKSFCYDIEELLVFSLVIALSVAPTAVLYLRSLCEHG